MYMKLAASDLRNKYGLPADYTVDSIIAVGTWTAYAPLNFDHLVNVLEELEQDFTYKKFNHPHLHEVFEFRVNGKVIWYFAVMGTAVMSEYLHKGSLLGSRKNILIGSAGALSSDCIPGDIICPTASKGNQNAWYYQRDSIDSVYKPDTALAKSLRSRLPADMTVHTGTTVTCEILMAETKADIDQWSQDGYLGVEMEAALLFSLSSHFGIPSAALLNIGDNLVQDVTFFDNQHTDSLETFEASRRTTIKAAIEEIIGA